MTSRLLSFSTALALLPCAALAGPTLDATDRFGRSVATQQAVLVDWEGQIANPAIKLFVIPPDDAVTPATLSIRGFNSRLYFNNPSTISGTGPAKTISMPDMDTESLFVSIFPDRDTVDELHQIRLIYTDAVSNKDTLFVSLRVVDQDTVRPLEFSITADFSEDPDGWGFFNDAAKRATVQQAADDWAYFFADMQLEPVPAGTEWSWIWTGSDYSTGYWDLNDNSYTGFLIRVFGHHTTVHRSGGTGTYGGILQQNPGGTLPLVRSGSFDAEVHGNYNTLGWYMATGDDDWYMTRNASDQAHDFYSVAMHEIGHCIGHNAAYPVFNSAVSAGYLADAGLLQYLGHYPAVDAACHLAGEVDPASQKGGYGNDYYGWFPNEGMPIGRWQITKLSLLSLRAVGYELRATTPFQFPSLLTSSPPNAQVGIGYSHQVSAVGGIPFYRFSVVSGSLPLGLTLNTFDGTIAGTPTVGGLYNLEIGVEDYGGETDQTAMTIVVDVSSCACDCHGDPDENCDGTQTIVDIVQTIARAFRNAPPAIDPNPGCPYEQTDVGGGPNNSCDGVTTIVDIVKMVNVTFRNYDPETEICDPCP